MKMFHLISMVLLAVSLTLTTHAQAFTKYLDPFNLSAYVTDPAEPIKKGMQQYHWVVEEEEPGRILAVYSHNDHEIKLNIFYNAEKIWFEQVSARNLTCNNCTVKERHLTNFRVGLRRGIAYHLTELALNDARRDS